MPPLAHSSESLFPDRQQLAGDPMDSACPPASSSFLGKLWPNRRKFAPFSKRPSVSSVQDIEDLQRKPSRPAGLNTSSQSSGRWIVSEQAQNVSTPTPLNGCSGSAPKQNRQSKCLDAKTLQEWLISAETAASENDREGIAMEVELDSFSGQLARVEVNRRDDSNDCVSLEVSEQGMTVVAAENRLDYTAFGEFEHQHLKVNRGMTGVKGRRVGTGYMLVKRSGSVGAGETLTKAVALKKMRTSTLCELQRIASFLQWGSSMDERYHAAEEVLCLCKDDPIARVTLGVQLGAIPPLVSMLHSSHAKHQYTALSALLNLASGNDVNKSLIVRSKGLQRLLPLMQNSDVKVQAAATSLLLSLSALDSNKEEIGLSGFIPALINLMQKDHTRRDALRALYNLSISPCNVEHIVKGGGVPFLLDAVSNASLTSKSLATLSNLAGTVVGRDAFGELKDVAYAVLVDAVRWVENAKCQERAVYILMMIAHHNPLQHDAMIAAGAIPVLLELSLLGSALARKRAARTLDSFRRSKVCSAPQQRQSEEFEILCSNGSQSMPRASSEKKVVDGLVKQSLYRTMQRITRRANLSMVMGDAMTSSVRSTTGSFRQVSIDRRSSSCSIPL